MAAAEGTAIWHTWFRLVQIVIGSGAVILLVLVLPLITSLTCSEGRESVVIYLARRSTANISEEKQSRQIKAYFLKFHAVKASHFSGPLNVDHFLCVFVDRKNNLIHGSHSNFMSTSI